MERRVGLWGRIGTKLYLALALAVLLTLLSSGVGVYYFEKSGDMSRQTGDVAVPALSGALEAQGGALALAEWSEAVAASAAAGARVPGPTMQRGDALLERTESALSAPAGVPELADSANSVYLAAAEVVDAGGRLAASATAMSDIEDRRSQLFLEAGRIDAGAPGRAELVSALAASDPEIALAELEPLRDGGAPGLSQAVASLASGNEGAFAVLTARLDLSRRIDSETAALRSSVSLAAGQSESLSGLGRAFAGQGLEESRSSFDQGRLLLFAICVASVLVALLTSWLWVGNNVLRRLYRLSERMQSMGGGDLETPVPEVGGDEIGRLAGNLELFRQQAIEVQRLNLVERLYGELSTAYDDLANMQERLVAQEKLAALGEIVSGVAHEISNPLNFVKNFAEGSTDLSDELFEMLDGYTDQFNDEDHELLDEIRQDLSDSLVRVLTNGVRALTIVQRMQALGLSDASPALTAVESLVRTAANVGLERFHSEFDDFDLTPRMEFSEDLGDVSLVGADVSEAVVNLVTNACYAMRQRKMSGEAGYAPDLLVSASLSGDWLDVSVKDNGTGIPGEVQERMFNPFFTTRDGAQGAGLGLTLAADLARRGGGSLEFETEVGTGAEFKIRLPTAVPEPAPVPLSGEVGLVRDITSGG